MQCYVGGRRSGKTQHLINLSHDTGIPIVTRSEQMAKAIKRQALRMGKTIPEPTCYRSQEMLLSAPLQESVLVDEAGGILDDVLGVHVVAATIDGEALRLANPALGNLESMGLLELLHTWRKEKKGKCNG